MNSNRGGKVALLLLEENYTRFITFITFCLGLGMAKNNGNKNGGGDSFHSLRNR